MNSNGYEYNRITDIKRLEFITNTIKKNIPAGGEVLDIGCGNGVISRYVAKNGYNVTGMDISEETIAKARSLTNQPNISFSVFDAEKMIADKKQYDAIICSEVLEHLHQPEKLVNVISQILKPSGSLIVTVPNGKGPREVFVTKPVQRLQKSKSFFAKLVFGIKKLLGYKGTTVQSDASDLTHVQFFTLPQLKKIAAENDFTITQVGKSNFVEDVFPFSLLAKRIAFLQKLDCKIADILPASLTGGFFTVWKKQDAITN